MFNVLIVDDEEPVLDSYEFMLNTFPAEGEKKSPFSLAGKARTGYEALKLINELKPDLVFLDINIPGMDGLDVLEDVYKKYPRMVFILSTAYERFDLARRAIPLGVFAYLVKPVSKKTFFSTLEKALGRLQSFSEDSGYSNPRLCLFRRDILSAMDEQRWSWYRETLDLPSEYGFFIAAETEKNMEKQGPLIWQQLSFKYHCTFDVILNRAIFLISEDLKPQVYRPKVLKILEDFFGSAVWYAGLGNCYKGPQLYQSYNEALAELGAQRRNDVWISAGSRIAGLRQKIGYVTAEETKSQFSEIWEPLFLTDFTAAKLRMVSLFTLLLDDIYGCWSAGHGTLPQAEQSRAGMPFDPAEIMELLDLDAWKLWAERSISGLAAAASLERRGNYPPPLVKALAYISENFHKSIQLTDAAEAASVNAAHLSRLFAKHLGTSFVDYLASLRIAEAERLFKEKRLSVKEAAHAVGFQDPAYFTRIYKKIKGILPTEAYKNE